MQRFLVLLLGLLVLFSFSPNIFAQNLPGLTDFNLSGFNIRPNFRAGYQKIGLNLSIPIPGEFGTYVLDWNPLEMKLLDDDVWVGGIGADLKISSSLSLFLDAEANAPKNMRALTESEPVTNPDIARIAVEWEANEFQWSMFDAGAEYRLWRGTALMAGVKREHISMVMEEPVDEGGVRLNDLIEDEYYGDLLIKTWIPYLGIRIRGANFSGIISYSPVIFTSVELPLRWLDPIDLSGRFAFEEAFYTLQDVGQFFEGSFDYQARVGEDFALTCWFKGSWLKVRGQGEEELSSIWGEPPASGSINESRFATGDLRRYIVSCGLGGRFSF